MSTIYTTELHLYETMDDARLAKVATLKDSKIKHIFDSIHTKEDAWKHAGREYNSITFHYDIDEESFIYLYMQCRIREDAVWYSR